MPSLNFFSMWLKKKECFRLLHLSFGSNLLVTRKLGQIDIFDDLSFKGTPSVFQMLLVSDKKSSLPKSIF